MATLLKDGRYKATWLNPATGKRESFFSRISPEDAERQKDERKKKVSSIRWKSGARPVETLEDCAIAYWWPSVEIKRPNTVRRYTDVWNRYIAPTFALRQPASITPSECQAWANALRAKGLAPSSLHLAKSVLSAILTKAEREGKVQRNVARYIELPTIKRREKSMSVADLARLLSSVHGTTLAAPVFLAAVLGMRRGELCALKWSNVDETTRRVKVTEQRLVRQQLRGKQIAEAAPKTDSSVRSFILPKPLMTMLMEVGDLDSGYVCTNERGKPWHPEHLTYAWAQARKGLGFESWRFHDLRHAAAGVLAALGVDLLTIGAILGQRNISTTQLYAAAQEATATKGLAKLAKALKR